MAWFIEVEAVSIAFMVGLAFVTQVSLFLQLKAVFKFSSFRLALLRVLRPHRLKLS